MKKIVFSALFISFAFVVSAQQDTLTIYQTPKGFLTDPVRNKWKRKLIHEDSLWVMQLLDKKGNLQEKISFADEKLTERKGPYEQYASGSLVTEGNYKMGYKKGLWTEYYSNKQLKQRVHYLWDKPDGKLLSYWPNGQVRKDGTYRNGVKTGAWKMYLEDGKLVSDETFDANGRKLTSEYFDHEGKPLEFPMILKAPEFDGGMANFYRALAGNIRYPANAAKNHIQGKVLLAFTIKADSSIEDIKVVSSPDDELSNEAIRVLKSIRGWKAGEELGEPVNMRHSVAINFALN